MELYFELKGTPESSQESYLRRLKTFVEYIQAKNKSINDITERDIQAYILYLKKDKALTAGTINNYISAIRFFYTHVLNKEWNKKKIPRMKTVPKLPVIPSRDVVLKIINATTNLKHKAILMLIYGSGLRVSEAARLKIGDICSKTMRVRVENAKHGTNRYAILSDTALMVLREYFKAYLSGASYHLEDWLFPGQNQGEHITVKSIKNTMINLRNKLGLKPGISAHTLRRCFATHCLEDGVETAMIQQMLGHKHISTTTTYLFLTSKSLMGIKSPLDSSGGGAK
jgi:site-specific recombinase XerD